MQRVVHTRSVHVLLSITGKLTGGDVVHAVVAFKHGLQKTGLVGWDAVAE